MSFQRKLICLLLLCFTNSVFAKDDTKISIVYNENKIITEEYPDSLSAACHNGTFVGIQQNGVISYKGIPYAQQPVGDLRWRPAREALPDDKVYQAFYYGKSPIQTEWPTELASYYEQGEDCLYLNVWSHANDSLKNLPVVVFIHGGAYGWGGTSDPLYDGQSFVEAHPDVIFVSVGYRTGIMGFIDLWAVDSVGDYKESCNLGLLDQVAALKWIQKNISSFGGDPSNVTLWGQGSGAGCVSLLTIMEQARGLMKRVIIESGTVALTYSKLECQPLTKMLLKETKATCMDDLLKLSSDELKELNEKLNGYANFPMRDGIVLPESLYEAYENNSSDVEMLIGTNSDEFRYWITEVGGMLAYRMMLPILFGNNTDLMTNTDKNLAYDFINKKKVKKVWRITEFYNDVIYRIPSINQASSNSRSQANTYMYYWTYPSTKKNLKACQGVELPFLLNNLEQNVFDEESVDSAMAYKVQEMWVNFIKTGNPSTENVDWQPYSEKSRQTMYLGKDCRLVKDPMLSQRKKLESMSKYYLNGNDNSNTLRMPWIYKVAATSAGVIGVGVLVALIISL
ncbi:MAG: carboxylesterase family protein [Bacteroidales bacterium]|nr:carboxylesterase family protein [Bacteroidales bacterium]